MIRAAAGFLGFSVLPVERESDRGRILLSPPNGEEYGVWEKAVWDVARGGRRRGTLRPVCGSVTEVNGDLLCVGGVSAGVVEFCHDEFFENSNLGSWSAWNSVRAFDRSSSCVVIMLDKKEARRKRLPCP